MSGFSDAVETSLLAHLLKGASFAQPANIYVALYTAPPTDAGGGTEVNAAGYARVLHNTWNVAGNLAENNGEIQYPQATAPWGAITHFGLHDHAMNDSLLLWGPLNTSVVINDADQATFGSGALDVTLD